MTHEELERWHEMGRWSQMADITREFREFGIDIHDPHMEEIAWREEGEGKEKLREPQTEAYRAWRESSGEDSGYES